MHATRIENREFSGCPSAARHCAADKITLLVEDEGWKWILDTIA